MPTLSVFQRLAGRPLVRRAADVFLSRQARRRVAQLDRCPAARVQQQTLLRLVRRARHTRFGRLHDFAGIHSVADYQQRVPLRDYEAFWTEFWQPAFPHLDGVTWPGLVPYFALSSGTTSGSTKYIPVSREMLASNRRAALTTLAFYQAVYPDLHLFRGRLFFLGGSTDLQSLARPALAGAPAGSSVLGGDLSGIAAREVPSVLHPYTFPPLTYPASEGFIATEDPRYHLLRLIPDHDVFFEFVPVEELEDDRPARHTIANLEPGVQYAVVLTTCAGLWSYVLGDTVCFERRDPPLLRFTGRTKYFLSAFGEHLISEEVERAVAEAAAATGTSVVDFHVGPVFPETQGTPGRHRYLVEFADPSGDMDRFARELDASLCRLNEDYQAHRAGDLTMLAPEVCCVERNGFAGWMRSRGKLGGQHKLPRMDNSGELTSEMTGWLTQQNLLAGPRGR